MFKDKVDETKLVNTAPRTVTTTPDLPFNASPGLTKAALGMLTSRLVSGYAPVAQWIEHLPSKQRVAGSSPAGGNIAICNF